jgi:tetratricopeptide (TPR) repeat protein
MTSRCLLLVVLLGMAVGLPMSAAAAPTECPEWAAKIVSIEGRVESLRAGDTNWQAVNLNDTYCPNDRVRTLENSRAAIQLQNETILRLDQNTVVRFAGLDPKSPTLLELIRGSAFFLSRFPRTLTIETPFVNAASGGTEFHIEVNEKDQTTTVTVIEGQMNVTNEAGSTVVTGGQAAITKSGQAPVLRVVVRPRDAIQWALYYPPILSIRDLRLGEMEGLPETDWRSMVQRSIASYREGDVAKAFGAIEGAPEDIPDPRFYTYRASLLLSVGQVDQAKADLKKAFAFATRNGLALAIQSTIAVVQNDPDKALSLALDAAEAEPDSVSVKMALSYAHQARFELSQALAAVQGATKLDPQDALARARLAELWLAHGELDRALEAAKEAVAVNPRESRAQTVLGFAYLTKIKISDAKVAFEQAITLAPADPMPRLGLGLAKIREGDLEGGRKQIEIAATLDPNNAMIRSYLGKAYYEEKRDPQAAIQFDMAKTLDPNDPTPYLYDAIRKQTINRPVEAMQDLQRSIELNDNRAVYRSRLLLDSDLAARSVSLARISEDLGFRQLALVEGWKSVHVDPANHSAHRHLADSYEALPRSEIARLSELMVSQLLQPLNNHPVQPRMGEGASAILAGAVPVDPSFNEFSQLFVRDRVQFVGSGIWGGNGTLGEEAIVSGLHKRLSYSAGQFHHETDGYRTNADMRETIYSVFTQIALTPGVGIQGEFRSNQLDSGDRDLRFDPADFSPSLRVERNTDNYRIGLHSKLNPSSDLLVSVIYQQVDEKRNDSDLQGFPPGISLSETWDSKGFIGETQYLFRSERLNLAAGAGRFRETQTTDISIPAFLVDISERAEVHHTNGYVYSYLNMYPAVTVTVGASRERFDGAPRDREQWNPKLGLTFNPTQQTTIRMARFRALRRSVLSHRTLEPTHVAGFQQFFDDLVGSDSRRSGGVAIDQKIGSLVFGGVELSMRDIVIPLTPLMPGDPILEVKKEERLVRSYLYASPLSWMVASAEYQLERLDSSDFTQPFAPNIKTHRVILGPNFYHRGGLFAKLRAIYVDQRGMFSTRATGTFAAGDDQFWLADAMLGHRFSKRRGMLTVEVRNVLDKRFRFHDTDPEHPLIQPERLIFARVTVTF